VLTPASLSALQYCLKNTVVAKPELAQSYKAQAVTFLVFGLIDKGFE
jgi:hypothetical protein